MKFAFDYSSGSLYAGLTFDVDIDAVLQEDLDDALDFWGNKYRSKCQCEVEAHTQMSTAKEQDVVTVGYMFFRAWLFDTTLPDSIDRDYRPVIDEEGFPVFNVEGTPWRIIRANREFVFDELCVEFEAM